TVAPPANLATGLSRICAHSSPGLGDPVALTAASGVAVGKIGESPHSDLSRSQSLCIRPMNWRAIPGDRCARRKVLGRQTDLSAPDDGQGKSLLYHTGRNSKPLRRAFAVLENRGGSARLLRPKGPCKGSWQRNR